jgi:small-conductance mechanosensitive channel
MRALSLLLSLAGAASLAAQQPGTTGPAPANAPEASGAAAAKADSATLTIGNRQVFVFRVPLGAFSAADRAEMAGDRIRRAHRAGADSVRVVRDTVGAIVMLNNAPVFVITPSDLPPGAAGDLMAEATQVIHLLHEGLGAAEEATNIRALAIGGVSVVAATIILYLLLRLLARGRSWLLDLSSRKLPELKVRGVELLSTRGLRQSILVALGVLSWSIGLLLTYMWVTYCLTRFAYTRPWGLVFGGFLATTAGNIGLSLLHSIPNLITIGLILLAARGILALLRRLFDAVEEGRISIVGLHPETVGATRRIVTALVWMFAIASAYPLIPGSDSNAFKGISVLAGVLVTFGSAGLVGQAMSGLLLMYARGFKVGDFIQAGTVQGTVVELGLLSTRVRNVANEFVLVPNSTMVNGAIVDYSAAGREGRSLFVTASVTIGYDAPWQRIHELLLAAGAKLEGALKSPEPFVLQRGLNDFYVHYEVFVPIDSDDATNLPRLRSQLHSLIQDTFWEAGQEITSPHFYALRDGNTVTIPAEHRPKEAAPSFRVSMDPK